MVKLIKKFLSVIFAMLLLPAAASAERVLVYSDHEPLGGMRTRFIKEVFFEALEKESNGRLKIEAHWDGELAGSYDALRTVGPERKVDMAIVVPEYSPNELPLQQVFKSFPAGPAGEEQVAFFRRAYGDIPAFSAELLNANVVNLFCATGYPVAFFSSGPLDTLDNLKGSRWRSASFWHQGFLRHAGATPVSIPWGEEIFRALQAKTLDGLMVNVDSGYMLKVHEVAPNVLLSKDLWLGHVYLLVMNKNTWDELSPEDRAAIQRAADRAYASLGSVMDRAFDEQVEALKQNGANVRILTPGEVDQWRLTTGYQDAQAAWVREQEEKGLKEAGLVLEKVGGLLNEGR